MYKKTIMIIMLLLIAILFISACTQTIPKAKCKLYINQDNQVNCFIENQQPEGWQPYQRPEIGIPYACYETDNGSCELAQ